MFNWLLGNKKFRLVEVPYTLTEKDNSKKEWVYPEKSRSFIDRDAIETYLINHRKDIEKEIQQEHESESDYLHDRNSTYEFARGNFSGDALFVLAVKYDQNKYLPPKILEDYQEYFDAETIKLYK